MHPVSELPVSSCRRRSPLPCGEAGPLPAPLQRGPAWPFAVSVSRLSLLASKRRGRPPRRPVPFSGAGISACQRRLPFPSSLSLLATRFSPLPYAVSRFPPLASRLRRTPFPASRLSLPASKRRGRTKTTPPRAARSEAGPAVRRCRQERPDHYLPRFSGVRPAPFAVCVSCCRCRCFRSCRRCRMRPSSPIPAGNGYQVGRGGWADGRGVVAMDGERGGKPTATRWPSALSAHQSPPSALWSASAPPLSAGSASGLPG